MQACIERVKACGFFCLFFYWGGGGGGGQGAVGPTILVCWKEGLLGMG